MNPVARIIPAANALTTTNRLRSGLRAGIERVTSGKQTPIMLVMRMEKIAIIFRGKARFLLLQVLFVSSSHSDEVERTWVEKIEMRRMNMEMSLRSLVAMTYLIT